MRRAFEITSKGHDPEIRMTLIGALNAGRRRGVPFQIDLLIERPSFLFLRLGKVERVTLIHENDAHHLEAT